MPAQNDRQIRTRDRSDPLLARRCERRPRCHRHCALLAMMVACLLGSCTLAKPLVGAVVGPVMLLAEGGCRCGSGEEAAMALCAGSVVGAGAGLVTGIISDFNWVTGRTEDPTINWHDPFATNR